MGKIATEQEAYNIGGAGVPTNKKCCTKTRTEALGCSVSGLYASNKLVQLADLSKLDLGFGDFNIVMITSLIGDNLDDINDDIRFAIGLKLVNSSKDYLWLHTFDYAITGTWDDAFCFGAKDIDMLITDMYADTTVSLDVNETVCTATTIEYGDIVLLNINAEIVTMGNLNVSGFNHIDVVGNNADDLSVATENTRNIMTFRNNIANVKITGNGDFFYSLYDYNNHKMDGYAIWLYAWL